MSIDSIGDLPVYSRRRGEPPGVELNNLIIQANSGQVDRESIIARVHELAQKKISKKEREEAVKLALLIDDADLLSAFHAGGGKIDKPLEGTLLQAEEVGCYDALSFLQAIGVIPGKESLEDPRVLTSEELEELLINAITTDMDIRRV